MKIVFVCVTMLATYGVAHAQSSSSSAASSSSDGAVSATSSPGDTRDCRTVYLKAGEKPPVIASDTMTSSVSAGNGSVSSTTSGGGVSSRAESGRGGGATSMSSSTSGGRTTIKSSDGACTVYVDPEAERNK